MIVYRSVQNFTFRQHSMDENSIDGGRNKGRVLLSLSGFTHRSLGLALPLLPSVDLDWKLFEAWTVFYYAFVQHLAEWYTWLGPAGSRFSPIRSVASSVNRSWFLCMHWLVASVSRTVYPRGFKILYILDNTQAEGLSCGHLSLQSHACWSPFTLTWLPCANQSSDLHGKVPFRKYQCDLAEERQSPYVVW